MFAVRHVYLFLRLYLLNLCSTPLEWLPHSFFLECLYTFSLLHNIGISWACNVYVCKLWKQTKEREREKMYAKVRKKSMTRMEREDGVEGQNQEIEWEKLLSHHINIVFENMALVTCTCLINTWNERQKYVWKTDGTITIRLHMYVHTTRKRILLCFAICANNTGTA